MNRSGGWSHTDRLRSQSSCVSDGTSRDPRRPRRGLNPAVARRPGFHRRKQPARALVQPRRRKPLANPRWIDHSPNLIRLEFRAGIHRGEITGYPTLADSLIVGRRLSPAPAEASPFPIMYDNVLYQI